LLLETLAMRRALAMPLLAWALKEEPERLNIDVLVVTQNKDLPMATLVKTLPRRRPVPRYAISPVIPKRPAVLRVATQLLPADRSVQQMPPSWNGRHHYQPRPAVVPAGATSGHLA
jgi:hypothetical protein